MTDVADSNRSEIRFTQLLGAAWVALRDNWLLLICADFVAALLPIIAGGLTFALFVDFRGWNLVAASVVGLLVFSALYGGYLRLCLKVAAQDKASIRDLFSELASCWQMLLLGVCFGVSLAVGLLLFVLPGFFIAAVFSLSGFALIDRKVGALRSMLESYRMLRGFRKYVAGLLVLWLLAECLTIRVPLPLGFDIFLGVALGTLYLRIRGSDA
jgi:Uncharacterised protein family (UPF0259)